MVIASSRLALRVLFLSRLIVDWPVSVRPSRRQTFASFRSVQSGAARNRFRVMAITVCQGESTRNRGGQSPLLRSLMPRGILVSMSYQKIFSGDGDSQDVEIFEAASMQCVDCGEETIVRANSRLWERLDASNHEANCRGKSVGVKFQVILVDWGFAFGSEGHRWDDPCEHYHYKTEAEALQAAKDFFEGTLNP